MHMQRFVQKAKNMLDIVGLRNLKTALAVMLCVIVSGLLRLEYPFYAAIAAIIVMQVTTKKTWVAGRNRMLGTFAGACMGVLLAWIPFYKPALCGAGIAVLILLCDKLGWNGSVSIAGIVFMRIMVDLEGETPLHFGLNRLLDTLIGIVIALLVNFLVFPFDHASRLEEQIAQFYEAAAHAVQAVVRGGEEMSCAKLEAQSAALLQGHAVYGEEFMKKKRHSETLARMERQIAACRDIADHLKAARSLAQSAALSGENAECLAQMGLLAPDASAAASGQTEEDIVFNYHVRSALSSLYKIQAEAANAEKKAAAVKTSALKGMT